jgi:hypothetical protein
VKVGFLTFPPASFPQPIVPTFFLLLVITVIFLHRSPSGHSMWRSQPDISWINDTGAAVPGLLQGRILR